MGETSIFCRRWDRKRERTGNGDSRISAVWCLFPYKAYPGRIEGVVKVVTVDMVTVLEKPCSAITVKDLSQAEDYYKLYGKRTILFVDEVHRWNKSQQDALLPWVENGTIILIGATTENPFFEVNKALVSRSRVFQLKPLTYDDLYKAANMAIKDTERGYGHWDVEFEEGALEHLIETANGDARSLLNALELAIETTPEQWKPHAQPPVPAYGSKIYISKENYGKIIFYTFFNIT